jgi:hypothetical protein
MYTDFPAALVLALTLTISQFSHNQWINLCTGKASDDAI